MQSPVFRRQSLWRLTSALSDLLKEPLGEGDVELGAVGNLDATIVTRRCGRLLVTLAKVGGPAAVVAASESRSSPSDVDGIYILAVPFMTAAGAEAARDYGLNWVDFAGNAMIRHARLTVAVDGRTSKFATRGRPSSNFAPRSSRVARALLLDPVRWWRQSDLARATQLEGSRVSRTVRRLDEVRLLDRDGALVRVRDRDRLLDAWANVYRPARHRLIRARLAGAGGDSVRDLSKRLDTIGVDHAFTGLAAGRLMGHPADPQPLEIYVRGDPQIAVAVTDRGGHDNGPDVHLISPADPGVFDGRVLVAGLSCVSAVQVYLDLLRWEDHARRFRADGLLWGADS